MRVVVSLVGLFLNDLVGFEQSNAQQQGQGYTPVGVFARASAPALRGGRPGRAARARSPGGLTPRHARHAPICASKGDALL